MSISSCYISTLSVLFPSVPSLTDCTLGVVKDLSHLCAKVYLGHATMTDYENCLYFYCYLSYNQNHILSWEKKEKNNIYDAFAVKISHGAVMSCRGDQLTQPHFLATECHSYRLQGSHPKDKKILNSNLHLSTVILFCFICSSSIFLHYQRNNNVLLDILQYLCWGKQEWRSICAYTVPPDFHSDLFF